MRSQDLETTRAADIRLVRRYTRRIAAKVVAIGLFEFLSLRIAAPELIDLHQDWALVAGVLGFGVIACGSALGGFFMNKAVAWFIDHRSYNDCFYVMAGLYPLAFLLVWNLRKRANAN